MNECFNKDIFSKSYITLHKMLQDTCSNKKCVNADSTVFTHFSCTPKFAIRNVIRIIDI